MDFFNIGAAELVFILVLAILLVGPKRAVELVQQGRKLLARVQQEWLGVQQSVMTEVEMLKDETLPELESLKDGTLKEVEAAQKGTLTEVEALKQEALAEVEALEEETSASAAVPSWPGKVGPGRNEAG
jgi:Sec-independent protein translocase protein TatA